jgi:hypothetical protein
VLGLNYYYYYYYYSPLSKFVDRNIAIFSNRIRFRNAFQGSSTFLMSYDLNYSASMCFSLSRKCVLSVCSALDILRKQTVRFDIIITIIILILLGMLLSDLKFSVVCLVCVCFICACLLSFTLYVCMLCCSCNWPSGCWLGTLMSVNLIESNYCLHVAASLYVISLMISIVLIHIRWVIKLYSSDICADEYLSLVH